MKTEFPIGSHTFDGELIWANKTTKVSITFEISERYEISCKPFEVDSAVGNEITCYMANGRHGNIDPFRFEAKPKDLLCFSSKMFLGCYPGEASTRIEATLLGFSFKKRTDNKDTSVKMSFSPNFHHPYMVPILLPINNSKSAKIINIKSSTLDPVSGRVYIEIEKNQKSNVDKANMAKAAEVLAAILGFAVGEFFTRLTQEEVSDGIHSFKSQNPVEFTRSLIPPQVISYKDIHAFLKTASMNFELNKNLDFLHLLHWYSSPKLHQENSYLNIFTMLEYLINKTISDQDNFTLNRSAYDKLSKLLRGTIREAITDEATQNSLIEKLPDLRRRSFISKLKIAEKKGFVSLSKMTLQDLKNIQDIRNSLVHGGDLTLKTEQIELAAKLKPAIYDLVNRMILNSLGWKGAFYSYKNGKREINSETKKVKTQVETEQQPNEK